VCQDLRLAVGGVNATPVRLRGAEARARGERLGEEVIRAIAHEAARETDPIADVQGSAEYRRDMVEVWVARALRRLGEQLDGGAR
jgi:carbon-monoxide dehydrogenase medium subunit